MAGTRATRGSRGRGQAQAAVATRATTFTKANPLPSRLTRQSSSPVAESVETDIRAPEEARFNEIISSARQSPERRMVTRSQRISVEPTVPAAATKPTNRSDVRRRSRRQRTPDDQLLEDLREASHKADGAPSLEPASSSPPLSSEGPQSLASWFGERWIPTDLIPRHPNRRHKREIVDQLVEENADSQASSSVAQSSTQSVASESPFPPASPEKKTPSVSSVLLPQRATPGEPPIDLAAPIAPTLPENNISTIGRIPVLNPTPLNSAPVVRHIEKKTLAVPFATIDTSQSTENHQQQQEALESQMQQEQRRSLSHEEKLSIARSRTSHMPSKPHKIGLQAAQAVSPASIAPRTATVRQPPASPHESPLHRRISNIPLCIVLALAVLTALGAIIAFRSDLGNMTPNLPFPLPFPIFGCSGPYVTPPFAPDGLEKLSSTFDRKLADMANDVAVVKDEFNRRLARFTLSNSPLAPMRVNFLSPRLGARVDPHLTSGISVPSNPNFVRRVANRLLALSPEAMTPAVALQHWNEVGECWCSTPAEPQLAVILGYPIVPDEVVIEHINKEATLSPELAPRHMELWAEFSSVTPEDLNMPNPDTTASSPDSSRPVPPYRFSSKSSPPPSSRHAGQQQSSSPPNSNAFGPGYAPPLPNLERKYVLETLRIAFPGEPDSAFSDHPRLGPTFFRLGTWEYDINSPNNIQRFSLNAVIDLPRHRMQRVIIRATSNWGGSLTCFYRVKLHGRY